MLADDGGGGLGEIGVYLLSPLCHAGGAVVGPIRLLPLHLPHHLPPGRARVHLHPPLEDDKVRRRLGPGERSRRETERRHEVKVTPEVGAHLVPALVHRAEGGQEGNDPTDADVGGSLGEKVVVDGRSLPTRHRRIHHAEVAEGDVPHDHVEVATGEVSRLEPRRDGVSLRVEGAADRCRDRVQLHRGDKRPLSEVFRRRTDERPDAGGGLKDPGTLQPPEAHRQEEIPDSADDGGRGVERRRYARQQGLGLVGRQKGAQLIVDLTEAVGVRGEFGQPSAAPTDVGSQGLAFSVLRGAVAQLAE